MALKEFTLENKIALVTGAGRGLGRGIAMTLAEAGADVVCVARTLTEIEETAAGIRSLGRHPLALVSDVTQPEQVENVVQKALVTFGHIDILVNNAGAMVYKPLVAYPQKLAKDHSSFFTNEGTNLEEWHRVVNTSLTAAYLYCRTVGPQMMEQRHGKVINIISVASARGFAFMTAYCAAKGGLALFTRALAREWGPFNIQVNAIGPSSVPTAMNAPSRRSEEATQQSLRGIPVRRFGTVREVGLLALYLASQASDYTTGQCIYLDGGSTA